VLKTRWKLVAAATGLAAAGAVLGPVPAQGASAQRPRVHVLTSDVGAPFNLQLTRIGILVADGFAGKIYGLRSGRLAPLIRRAPGAAGVAVNPRTQRLAYTTTVSDQGPATASGLTIRGRSGVRARAHMVAYEKRHNPDGRMRYGLRNPTRCQARTLRQAGVPVSYRGIVESHAYSVAAYRKSWLVADAGGNDLLRVNRHGRIRTVAVLPAQPLRITRAIADAQKLDRCIVGERYRFEAVPTDVEVRRGKVYVTTLPGGPEDPSLGARGSVYRVNPKNGHVRRIATGLAGATNLAVGRHGRIFVTELFAGRISSVRRGHVRKYVDLPGAVSVEAGGGGRLYAGTLDLTGQGPGTVVRISPR